MTIYEHTTRTDFRNMVYNRLGDNGVFWPESEINLSIEEALLTFGAISNFWREEISFLTEENVRLYDLFSDVVAGSEFIYPQYKYRNVIDWINKDLIENISELNPVSEILSLAELLEFIKARHNLYQQLTSLIVEIVEIDSPPNQNLIVLPDYLIDTIRVSFTDDDGNKTILNLTDEAELMYFDFESLQSKNTPQFYTIALNKTKTINLYPAPNVNGKIEVLFIGGVDSSIELDPETVINLPNNLVPYLKYGVEMDIFGKEGIAQDLTRAAYCKQRWEEGIQIGLTYNSVLFAKVNGLAVMTDSITNTDLFYDSIKVRTPPTILGFAGYNVFQTDIVPSSVVASINLLVIANAKIPIDDADFIKVDIEYLDSLVDYVVHLSKMKSGAAELMQTNTLKDSFIKAAINHNRRLQLKGITYETLIDITKKEEFVNPRVVR